MTWPFLRAYEIKEKNRVERLNSGAHLLGMYFYEALCDVSPLLHAFAKKGTKARPFRSAPYELSGEKKLTEEEREKREEQERLRASLYMRQMIYAGKNWGAQKRPDDGNAAARSIPQAAASEKVW